MDVLINYFNTIPSEHRSLLLVFGLSFFWILENGIPLFNFRYNKWRHAAPNLFFTLTTVTINFSLAFLLLYVSDWVVVHRFGLLYFFDTIPKWLYVLTAILFLDLVGAYIPHYIEHKFKPLWMVHLVHHTDEEVDVTTSTRHHPIESIIRYIFTVIGVFLIGVPVGIVLLYQSFSLLSTQFNHANIKLPKRLDYLLSFIIVSPDMHKVHHHYQLPYTDANYGNIFSLWDHLFGTYLYLDRNQLIYGLDTFPNKRENKDLIALIKQPFQAHRKPTTMDTKDN